MSVTPGETIVVVRGKKMTKREVELQYQERKEKLLIITKPTVRKILGTLLSADFPKTRKTLAKDAGVTPVHMGHLLSQMAEMGFVLRMNEYSLPYLYALTEKGYEAAKRLEQGQAKAEG